MIEYMQLIVDIKMANSCYKKCHRGGKNIIIVSHYYKHKVFSHKVVHHQTS